jgi:hypothetical protein
MLRRKHAKLEKFLTVEDMKHNILSVSQMCDQGHRILFDSEKCEIRKEGSSRLVAIATRTPNKIYVINEIGKEFFCMGKENESWLWNKRMVHMNFDILIKISIKEAVREIPEISRPKNTLCKHCLQGKKTRTKLKSKEYSMTKPLDIVHIDLCGPTINKGLNGEQYLCNWLMTTQE